MRKKILKKLKKSSGKTFQPKDPESLWYFCSFETFVKMFDKKRMWFSDVVKSNDENELLISQLIQDNPDNEFNEIWNSLAPKGASREFIDLLKLDRISKIASPCHVWASCFTTDVDNLWMWKEYGDNFQGVAIEFSYEKLKRLVNLFNDENDLISFYLFPVKYGNDISDIDISKLIKQIKQVLHENTFNQSLMNSLGKSLSQYKSESFSLENEYRIIALNEVKQRIRKKIGDSENKAAGNRVINSFGDNLTFNEGINSKAIFKTHIKRNEIVSHIECKIDLKELVSSIKFCKNHYKEEIEEILRLSLGDNSILVEKQRTSYRTK